MILPWNDESSLDEELKEKRRDKGKIRGGGTQNAKCPDEQYFKRIHGGRRRDN
jgi:hypothetical protein